MRLKGTFGECVISVKFIISFWYSYPLIFSLSYIFKTYHGKRESYKVIFKNITYFKGLTTENQICEFMTLHSKGLYLGLLKIERAEINIRDNRLKSISEAFKFELELEILDLGKNPLKQIGPKAFIPNVRQLKTLILDQCELFSLHSMVFQYLTKLEKLDLSHNKLETISPEIFQGLRNLREINLSDNEIRILGDLFTKNSRLERIDLSENLIKSCDSIFYGLQNLKSIDLSDNQLENIKKSDFLTTPSITNLILSKNNISKIESGSFSYLEQLTNLSLSFNRLMSLNNSLKNAPELETLLLKNNQFTELGKNEFSNSPKLKKINLGHNSLTDIHGAFRNLISLETLTISQNRLTTLTRSTFSEPFKLKVLYASGNRWKCDCRFLWLLNSSPNLQHHFLCYSPPRFNKKVLSQLNALDLTRWTDTCEGSACRCSCIPREEKFFVRVDCSNRNLTEVPPKLPPEVGELYLQNNLLTNPINLNIHSLTYLRYLDVERNNLSNVDFYLPKSLETFKLASNNLTRFLSYFPPSISSWTLSNNPWICDCDAIQFLKFLKSESNKVVDINATRCGKIGKKIELYGKLINELTEYELCPERLRLYIFLGVSLAMTTLTAISVHIVYTRYRYHLKVWLYSRGFSWLKKKDDRDSEKKHDAFLSFSDKDLDFVRTHLIPELEEKDPFYSTFVPPRDMHAGKFEIDYIMEEVKNSKRIIILLSQNYIENEFCMEVFRVAFASCLEEKLYRLIPIVIGTLPPASELEPILKAAIESTKCLRFGQRLFWEMVKFAMPEKTLEVEEYGNECDIDMPLLNAW